MRRPTNSSTTIPGSRSHDHLHRRVRIVYGYLRRRERSLGHHRLRPSGIARLTVRRQAPHTRSDRSRASGARDRPAPSRATACSCHGTRARRRSRSIARSDRTRRGPPARPRRARPAPHAATAAEDARRTGRQRLDGAREREPARVHRGEQHAQRGLDAADPVRRLPELDRLVDLGVRRVVRGDGVGRAVEKRRQAGRRIVRRAERRVDAQRRRVGPRDDRTVRPWVAAPRPTPSVAPPRPTRRSARGDAASRRTSPAGPRPSRAGRGRAQPAVETWVRCSRAPGTSRHHVGEDREVARDGRLLGRGRPAAQAEHGRDEPVVRLGALGQADVLGMVDDRQPERARVSQRCPQDRRRPDGRPIVREPDDAGIGELAERRELSPLPAPRSPRRTRAARPATRTRRAAARTCARTPGSSSAGSCSASRRPS